MPADPHWSFCLLTRDPAPRLVRCLTETLRGEGLSGAEVLVIAGREELEELARKKHDEEILVLLEDGLVPGAEWLQGLRARGADFDVLTSRVRGPDGRTTPSPPGRAGTAARAYVVRAIGWPDEARGETFAERCRRFGFRVAELREGALAAAPAADPPRRAGAPETGINLFGFLSGNLGLGVTARHYLRSFLDAGVPVQPIEILVGGGRALHDLRYRDITRGPDQEAPYPVNLFLMNPPDVEFVTGSDSRATSNLEDRINVCLPFWELPHLPPAWIPTLERMDIVLAASRFIQHVLLADLAGPIIRYLPHPMVLEPGISADRKAWKIPEGSVAFVTSFELASDVNRKNPLATIQAFKRAFSSNDQACLLVKVNNSKMDPAFEERMQALCDQIRDDPRIVLVDQVLPYRDVLSLYASADVLVSLHRAEGLGLPMLEAMSLGKPVIATGWSGNLDFMNERNSCLVSYDFIPVQASTQTAYTEEFVGDGAMWADPDLEEAAIWMRRLADDAELRHRIGRQAGADMAERQRRIHPGELLAAVHNLREMRGGRTS